MIKMLSMGEMKVYAFDLQKAANSMADVNTLLMNSNVREMTGKLPLCQHCTLSKGEVMHIPQGWYVMEVATKGPLCYGVRKSFLVNTVDGKGAYAKSKDMFHHDGRDVAKMIEVLKCFTV
jgi:hypothetical protein